MWVDYWGATGYVAPPLKLLGGLTPRLFLRLSKLHCYTKQAENSVLLNSIALRKAKIVSKIPILRPTFELLKSGLVRGVVLISNIVRKFPFGTGADWS